MEKRFLERRLAIMREEGVLFQTGREIGVNIFVDDLRRDFDAIVFAIGACQARDLRVPGRELSGIHLAMEYLTQQNMRCEGDTIPPERLISAEGKRVVIIGGGDTGADCLGTAHRQGACSVHQFELLPRPPEARAADNPWPEWPNILRVSPAHEEGGERVYAVSTEKFTGDEHGRVARLHAVNVAVTREHGRLKVDRMAGTEIEFEADLVLLALGFSGPEPNGAVSSLGLRLTERGTVWRDDRWMTSVPGVFTAGDMQRGQSLIVWAIADGRSAARSVDAYLMGSSTLPAPVA
jgi:glutamate synthase (NADPH/NADH) small chain